jgi:hypothetical protein
LVISLKKLKMGLVGMNESGLAAAGSEAEVELVKVHALAT